MPNNPSEISKYWGKAKKASLASLVNTSNVELYNGSLENIESVWREHFPHRDTKNFRSNFRKFASAWALEVEHSRARRGEETMGEFERLCILILTLANIPPLSVSQYHRK